MGADHSSAPFLVHSPPLKLIQLGCASFHCSILLGHSLKSACSTMVSSGTVFQTANHTQTAFKLFSLAYTWLSLTAVWALLPKRKALVRSVLLAMQGTRPWQSLTAARRGRAGYCWDREVGWPTVPVNLDKEFQGYRAFSFKPGQRYKSSLKWVFSCRVLVGQRSWYDKLGLVETTRQRFLGEGFEESWDMNKLLILSVEALMGLSRSSRNEQQSYLPGQKLC